jgi:hypothetical protein
VLLVWDNFESALPQFNTNAAAAHASPYTDDERARLYDLFRDLTSGPGDGALLVTCRPGDTGLPGAYRHELLGLTRADSLWLLAAIGRRHGLKLSDPRLGRERIEPLLDDLSDHPLSIELVGPHLKTLTPEAIRADFAPTPQPGSSRTRQPLPMEVKDSTRRCSRRSSFRAATSAPPRARRCRGSGCFSGGVFEAILLDVSQIRPDVTGSRSASELQGSALVRVRGRGSESANRPFLRFHPTLPAAAAADARLAQQPAEPAALHRRLPGTDADAG